MGKKNAKLYFEIRRTYQEDGDLEALDKGRALLESQQNISLGDRERLLGYLEGGGKVGTSSCIFSTRQASSPIRPRQKKLLDDRFTE